MCGIAGVVTGGRWSGDRLADVVAGLGDVVAHRGPDDTGTWCDPDSGVGLAHRRLAVVDLSPCGHQPMVSANGRYVLVFNGEIYDHRQLRRELEAVGTRFRGTSDTEVLLEGIAHWGLVATLERSNGMFALAVWDRYRRELSLARDRLGEKPLYVGEVAGVVAFGSELTVVRSVPGAAPAVDRRAVALYVRHGFVPAPWTLLEGVRKVRPGTVVTVDATGRQSSELEYWSLRAAAEAGLADPLHLPDEELVDVADELLRDSVALRREADVPVGTFLSGGVDSSLVAGLLTAGGGEVRTFTVAVGGELDESAKAAAVAAHLGTRHATLELDTDVVAAAPQALALYDEPFADPSAIPTALLCRAVRSEVTVALSGDGGDEILAGYNRYRAGHGLVGRLGGLPVGVRRAGRRALTAIPAARWDSVGGALGGRLPAFGDKAHKLGGLLEATDPYDAYLRLATLWEPATLLPGVVEPPTAVTDRSSPPPGADPLHRMLFADTSVTLPDDMLVKVDRASMAVALEVRVPLLDHRLVELSWRLPTSAKVRGGRGKWLLRAVLDRYVPSELVSGPKTGFDPPLGAWLRGPLRPWADDLLSPDRLRRQGLLDPGPVRGLWDSHLAGRRHAEYPLWALLALSAWLDAPVPAAVRA